jgi:hypothetical protein
VARHRSRRQLTTTGRGPSRSHGRGARRATRRDRPCRLRGTVSAVGQPPVPGPS